MVVLLNSHQFGFRKGKSLADPLIFLDYLINSSIKTRKHISIVSLDFAKAFDKIGIHTILKQLEEWGIGHRVYNYIKNYLTNRKIKVRVDSCYSETRNLYNGIPQGSPLSVVLFLIAYNSLSDLLQSHKDISFISYADDFLIIKKLSSEINGNINMDQIIDEIEDWCKFSGAELSLQKCKHLHICRKHNCAPDLNCRTRPIPSADTLKILGITFNNRYKWNSHIEQLILSLSHKLNIIKCLSNKKFQCNTFTLVSIVKSLIISKLSYGIFIYGYTAKSFLNKLKTSYNSAVRLALGAHRTTKINNMLYEANLMTIENYRDLSTANLFKTILFNDGSPLMKLLNRSLNTRKFKNTTSALSRIVLFCEELNIPFNRPIQRIRMPQWELDQNLIDTSLRKYNKEQTIPDIYSKELKVIQNNLIGHSFLFTDGSKSKERTSYSLVENKNIIKTSLLPDFSSIFSAEIIAILEATLYAKKMNKRFTIFSDSLSSLDSISNVLNNEFYPSIIRNILMQQTPKLKLVWIPGHKNIPGNEFADRAAKDAIDRPLTSTENISPSDIKKYIKSIFIAKQSHLWDHTSAWYKSVNTSKQPIIQHFKNDNIKRKDQIKITRLRLGHCKFSHDFIFDSSLRKECPFCKTNVNTVKHIVVDCPISSQRQQNNNINILELLKNVNQINNKITILNFLHKFNLFNSI